jgi:uncharacterized protein YukE
MALGDALKFAILLEVIDNASATLGQVAGKVDNLGAAFKGIAAMEVFQKASEGLEAITGAASGMETVMARAKAATGLQNEQLAKLKEHAEAFSETHFGAAAEQYVDAFQKSYQMLHNFAAAQKEADDAVRLAGATGAGYIEVVSLMNVAHENLGTSSTDVANKVAAATRQFAIGPEQMGQMTLGIAKMAPAIKTMGGNLDEALAIAGEAEQLMGGGRGVQMIGRLTEQLPGIAVKAHLSLTRGLTGVLEQIRARTQGLGAQQQISVLAGMGIDRTMAPEIMRLVGSLKQIEEGKKAIAAAGGQALSAEEAANAATFEAQSRLLSHAWQNLEDALGTDILPFLTKFVERINVATQSMRAFAENHPLIAKVGIAILAIAGAAGGLGMVGIALSIIGSGLKVLKVGEVLTKAWTAAQWLLNAAMDANPIGLVIIAVAALAVAVYEIYKNWDGIKAFFVETWRGIVALVNSVGTALYNAGANIIHMLAAGIKSGAHAALQAVEGIAESILGHFKGSSPPPLGPLHQLSKVHIVETIAQTMQPAPALFAARRVAAALAAVGLTIAASPSSGAMAQTIAAETRAGTRTVIVHVNNVQNITIKPGADVREIMAALRTQPQELVNIIANRLEHEERKKY